MPLELANVPQILSMLKDKEGNALTEAQIDKIRQFAKSQKPLPIFDGEAAVTMGIITEKELQAKLLQQALMRADAAEKDIETIRERGLQKIPNFNQAPYYGYQATPELETLPVAAQVASGLAQDGVDWINGTSKEVTPKNRLSTYEPAVKAAVTLTRKLADPEQAAKMTVEEREALIKGIRPVLAARTEGNWRGVYMPDINKIKVAHAAAVLKTLDMGVAHDDGTITISTNGQSEADGKIGPAELARLADVSVSGNEWSKDEQSKHQARREEMFQLLDTNDDNVLTWNEINDVARAAGVKVDAAALETVLETGQLPKPNVGRAQQSLNGQAL